MHSWATVIRSLLLFQSKAAAAGGSSSMSCRFQDLAYLCRITLPCLHYLYPTTAAAPEQQPRAAAGSQSAILGNPDDRLLLSARKCPYFMVQD